MRREFNYTKERLLFILENLLEKDVRACAEYQTVENAEEGFEKRAALEFVAWFVQEAFPDGFEFECAFDSLDEDYAREVAERIVNGRGWAASHLRDKPVGGNVVVGDFRKP